MGAQLHDVESTRFKRIRNETILFAVQQLFCLAVVFERGLSQGLSERQDA